MAVDIVGQSMRFGKHQNWKCARSNRCRAHCFCKSLVSLVRKPLVIFSPVKKSGWPHPPSSRRNWHMAERVIVLCVAIIAELFGMVIEPILANAKKVRNALHELGAHASAREPSLDC